MKCPLPCLHGLAVHQPSASPPSLPLLRAWGSAQQATISAPLSWPTWLSSWLGNWEQGSYPALTWQWAGGHTHTSPSTLPSPSSTNGNIAPAQAPTRPQTLVLFTDFPPNPTPMTLLGQLKKTLMTS